MGIASYVAPPTESPQLAIAICSTSFVQHYNSINVWAIVVNHSVRGKKAYNCREVGFVLQEWPFKGGFIYRIIKVLQTSE